MQKPRERRPSLPPVVLATAADSRWDAFATECIDWMMTHAENGILARADSGEGRLLAIFDVFGDWFDGRDREAASIVSAVLKLSVRHPVGRVVARRAPRIQRMIVDLGRQAGLTELDDFSRSWQILMKGAVLNASEGDVDAPVRARDMGRDLIARHRRRRAAVPPLEAESEFSWVDASSPTPSALRAGPGPSAAIGDADWFDVYGWDGDFTPVPYPA